MCTIAILFGVAESPVVLAANRDELYARPTRGPEVLAHTRHGAVVGGIDVQAGGTWLAIRADGRFAAVTNHRAIDPNRPASLKSRGTVVRELAITDDPDGYVAALDPRAYASMNVVWGDADRVSVAYTRRELGTLDTAALPHGVHVLANDRLGSPGFPGGDRLHAAIDQVLALPGGRRWAMLESQLRTALASRERCPIDQVPPSHLPQELARELTATCIYSPTYGTRSSTIAAIERGRVSHYLFADGPPDVTPYRDITALESP